MPVFRNVPKHPKAADSDIQVGSSAHASRRHVRPSTRATPEIRRAVPTKVPSRDNRPQPSGGARAGSRTARTPLSLSDLECIRTLGSGAFGKVLAVRSRHRPSAQFAVKAVNKGEVHKNELTLAYDSVFTRKRWNEERAILVSLPWNPFFNGLIDTFVDERNLYYVLELAPVGSLHKYLREYGPVTDDAAQFYFANIVLGLEFLHSHNIVHRDLKPGNILMGGDGYLSLGDFGAAAHVDETGSWAAGTPEYQMPELLRKEAVPKEQRMTIDWWSAAVCLYEIVARKVPFYGTDERILAKAASGKIMWGHQVVWHPDLKDLLTRMLGAERYGSTTYQAPSDEIPLNHELRSHDWVHDLNWTKIAQRREAAPFVPVPYPDMTDGFYEQGMPQQSTIPGLKRAPYQYHRCINKAR